MIEKSSESCFLLYCYCTLEMHFLKSHNTLTAWISINVYFNAFTNNIHLLLAKLHIV